MTITSDLLISIKTEIERLTKIDPQITDVIISIELKKENEELKNFMYIQLPNK
tara:strand:+ start:694 stop:852 length:159 start_codon:yes stop_codon:yes gene_type:complete